MSIAIGLLFLFGLPGAVVSSFVLWKKLRQARRELERFRPILSVEQRIQQIEGDYARIEIAARDLQRQKDSLVSEVGALEQAAELRDVGLLAPRYNFAEAVEYKIRLDRLRDEQTEAVRTGSAAVCSTEWTISGSRSEGKKTTAKILKLMLRAFNGECDALITKVRYDNAVSFEDRIRKSWDSINKLGAGFYCSITPAYLAMKMQELHLTHEYQEKLQADREEQRALREQMRDEERAQKEFEKAQRDAEQEEQRYAHALERARQEAEHAVGAKQQKLLDQVRDLEQKVQEAEERKRAVSMAQLTRTGHVYILSNVGSFGEHVYKVGMTRRLDPQDRVDELGDASVPFAFDVHAMISATDAPTLEKRLHDLLDARRLNRVNRRKEFFHATLEEIEQVVRQHHGEFRLTRQAEAIEYRKSLVLAEQLTASGVVRRAS
jgi:hypothetical protein